MQKMKMKSILARLSGDDLQNKTSDAAVNFNQTRRPRVVEGLLKEKVLLLYIFYRAQLTFPRKKLTSKIGPNIKEIKGQYHA